MSAHRIGLGTLGAGALAALALALTLAAAGGSSPAGPAQAVAAHCVPVQHSKKHIHKRKLKRNGKAVTKRRKHIHRWTSCEPIPPPACTEPSSNLGVTANDNGQSSYSLSRPCVTAGDVNVGLNNTEAMDPHNVFLRRADSGSTAPAYRLPGTDPFEVDPGTTASASFNLTAGEWYLWCDLLLHEEQGMHATLLVG